MGDTVDRLASGMAAIEDRFTSLEDSLQNKMDEKLREILLRVDKSVLQSALHNPRPPPSPPQARESLDSLLEGSSMQVEWRRSSNQPSLNRSGASSSFSSNI